MIRAPLGLSVLLSVPALAQDGGQLYATYCGACHAPDGEGATGGQFPPLAGSAWVQGDPERAIQIVLHGMEGPVEVRGKGYNLVMPPQGAVLPDEQIAAILTYVRSSWGNGGGEVTKEAVAKARAATADRNTPWTAPELLKAWPFPKQETPLKNLTSRIYHGSWKKLPDFEALEARNVEEEHDGIISLDQADREDGFGMVWEADFMAEEDGEYYFRFACDDGGRVLLDGEVVLEVHGTGPMSGGRTVACILDLKKGAHPLRVEYYQLDGPQGIGLAWKGPGDEELKQLTDTAIYRSTAPPDPIMVEPTAERAAIYRNFIEGTTHRAIGIGFPGGVNLAYSADHLAPELVWTGAFMDASRHWTNRGQGAQPPAGENVVRVTSEPALPEGSRFRGYQLDRAGNPTFTSTFEGLRITDQFTSRDTSLARYLRLEGEGDSIDILIAENIASATMRTPDGSEAVAPELSTATKTTGSVTLTTVDGLVLSIDAPRVHPTAAGYALRLAPGESATMTYSWK